MSLLEYDTFMSFSVDVLDRQQMHYAFLELDEMSILQF